MSILQEYEEIKRDIGEIKWNALNLYLLDRKDILLSDVLYHEDKWDDFENWYNKTLRNRDVKILNHWDTDYGDIAFQFILYQGNRQIVNAITSMDIKAMPNNNPNILKEIERYIYLNFEKFEDLPKISNCSKLLQEIYDSVCDSDACMCHIDDNDWKEFYSDRYTEKDIKKLEEEIKQYGLDDVIGIDDCEYKIVGYGDLQTKFNDDRNLKTIEKSKERMER